MFIKTKYSNAYKMPFVRFQLKMLYSVGCTFSADELHESKK